MFKHLGLAILLSAVCMLNSANTADAEIARALRLGATGSDVLELQQFLATEGFLTVKPSGYFGPSTKKAVQKWQKTVGTKVTGIVPKGFMLVDKDGIQATDLDDKAFARMRKDIELSKNEEIVRWKNVLDTLPTRYSLLESMQIDIAMYMDIFELSRASYPDLVDASKRYASKHQDFVGVYKKTTSELETDIKQKIEGIRDVKIENGKEMDSLASYIKERDARNNERDRLISTLNTNFDGLLETHKTRVADLEKFSSDLRMLTQKKAALSQIQNTINSYTPPAMYTPSVICNTTTNSPILSNNRTYTSTCAPDTRTAQEKCDARKAAYISNAYTDPTGYKALCTDLGL